MSEILRPDIVEAVFRECLFNPEEEEATEQVIADGVVDKASFHPGRLEAHRKQIEAMLTELPESFRKDSPEQGTSFLQACFDWHGNQWTGLHQRMAQLFQLGMAIGKVTCPVPRELWSRLPGGMPYYIIG